MTYYAIFLLLFIIAVICFVIYAGHWFSLQRETINVPRGFKYVERIAFPQMAAIPEFLLEDPMREVEIRVTQAEYQIETIKSPPLLFTWFDRMDPIQREHTRRRAEHDQKQAIFKAIEPFFETKLIDQYGPYGEQVQETQIMVLKRVN